MRARFAFALFLFACGAKQSSSSPPPVVIAPDASVAPTYDPSGCTPQPGITADTCAEKGCQVGPPPSCSGVQGADDDDRHAPCECVCPAEIEKCAEMP